MAEPVDSLASLRAFVAAADTRSFKLAAQELGLSSSAIGKAIARLEGQLATTLFHRTTRTISLTESGAIFLVRARRMLEELHAGEAELAEAAGSPRGKLRVSLPLTGSLFTRALAAFVAEYPHVELDLDYSDRIVDVVEEGFDVVIRTGDTGDSRLLHKTLGSFTWLLVAAPSYLEKHGEPRAPRELFDHVCLRQKFSSGRIAPWPLKSAPGQQVPVSLSASVIDPLLDLAQRGGGIGCFPEFLVREGLANGRLRCILENEVDRNGVLTMLWPASRFRVPKVRAFVDLVSNEVRAEVAGAKRLLL
ncbi:LysR family transcriptional regulator [Rhizobium sp. L51/94]|uniref:LysR family transcriptional regulator n=1 Tax=Rhizobium sp. L51/94 TaxID=2819999 RepID=UPI001C5B946A|nr:LysR family transcriptional regulator [Rhizobium sp. L51/94]QXZ80819.1 LysR family transcriptional regulator [Rhizobium sp. L51/94]